MESRFGPIAGRVAIGLVLVFLGIQFIPVNRQNPPVTREIEAPSDIRAILERACFDCHSNQTQWPWYSGVAPFSWLLAHDVDEGRMAMNFSEWDFYDEDEQIDLVESVGDQVEDGEMPPWFYLPLHPSAYLHPAEIDRLLEWRDDYEPIE